MGYRLTDPELDLLSMRQYRDAVRGCLAAAHIRAAAIAEHVAQIFDDKVRESPAAALLGLATSAETTPSGSAQIADLRQRYPHWFTPGIA